MLCTMYMLSSSASVLVRMCDVDVVAIISTCGGGGYTAMRCCDDML